MIVDFYSGRQKCILKCEDCNETREVKRVSEYLNKNEHPCRTCSNRRNGANKIGKYTAWNSGKRYSIRETERTEYVNTSGYVEVWCGRGPESRGRKDGYRLKHHLVMEDKIGRKLLPGEVVHHINGDKKDNRPENLFLCATSKEHRLIHSKLEKVSFELFKKGFIVFDEKSQTYKAPLLGDQ